ncbi:MAG: HAD-IIA family hydrolase [Anaerolineales bacterium]
MKKSNYENLKTILLDMDGVLWRGDQPLVDMTDLFDRIQGLGLSVYCVTNNSARTVEYYLKKLCVFGVDLKADQIITSAEATANYLINKYPGRGTLYVVGESGLVDTLESFGFRVDLQPGERDILAVVVGLDRQLTYQKIDNAARLIRIGAEFIGTNPDQTIPAPTGISPGAGTVIGAIEIASNQQALIIGKPQSQLFNLALSRSGAAAEQALMVGDRLNTDIAGAQRLGIRTALVISGVTTREEAKIWRPAPDIIVNDVLAVLDQIQNDEK